MNPCTRILQIMPAAGQQAVHIRQDETGKRELFVVPLIGWALIENIALDRFVDGLEAGDTVDLCLDCDSFMGFLREGSNLEQFAAKLVAQGEKKRSAALKKSNAPIADVAKPNEDESKNISE